MLKTVNNVRYLNKNNNANERENYSKWWKEQIEHYGTSVTYYTHGYSLNSHNFLYGEDPTSKYGKVENMIMLTDITNDALMLSKFGIMADCDMTAVIHISSFYDALSSNLMEPKAGDLIQLTEYGADRPGGRSAPIYEITERDDEYLQMTNSLIGHYVWYIKCKRYEYSYEPGVPNAINSNKQINDTGMYGRLEGGENPAELLQPYSQSVQRSSDTIYDYYEEAPPNNSEIYGYYGEPPKFYTYTTSNPKDKFNITLLFSTIEKFTPDEERYIQQAAEYWASVLKDTILPAQSVPDIYLHSTEETVDSPLPPDFQNTGMVIVLEKFNDPNSNVLAYAATSEVRTSPGNFYDEFTAVGSYVTNAAKMTNMLVPTGSEIEPQYYWVALHEICHLLGISSRNWQILNGSGNLRRTFYVAANPVPLPTTDIFYSTKRNGRNNVPALNGTYGPRAGGYTAYNEMFGPNDSYALSAYNDAFGLSLTAIPLENAMGTGSYGSHWHEGRNGYPDNRTFWDNSVPGALGLGSELMTPISESNGNPAPASKITLGGLRDLGWVIDYSKAHAFVGRTHTIKGTPAASYIRLHNYDKWSLINYNKMYPHFKKGVEYTLINETEGADFEMATNETPSIPIQLTTTGNVYKFTIPSNTVGNSVTLLIKFPNNVTKLMVWSIN
jgi:hypothetical protein